jgi:hypothetical protein
MSMNVTQANIDSVIEDWNKIAIEATAYFERMWATLVAAAGSEALMAYDEMHVFQHASDTDRNEFVPTTSREITRLVAKIIETSKSSPLVSDVDRSDLRVALRQLLASLNFRRYHHWTTNVLSDEDRVLGVEPPGQREDDCKYQDAVNQFNKACENLARILNLLVPSDTPEATAIARSETTNIKRYRPNTAFIMMWISKDHPELEDVKNVFKEVFKQFGITAVRSDEIEHSDQITQRILDEIATSEFLIADLTGERTSVYYEIGYAHALGKRPILYRKANTKLGFDLAGHHCPEYANLTDLRKQLETRLSALTNRTAADVPAVAIQVNGV